MSTEDQRTVPEAELPAKPAEPTPTAKLPETPIPVRRGRDVLDELRDSFKIRR